MPLMAIEYTSEYRKCLSSVTWLPSTAFHS